MPAPISIEELLDMVRKSGVVEEKRLEPHLDKLRTTGQLPPDPVGLATLLVRDGILTRFQAEQMLQGKWRRFMLGKYRVLERLGQGGMGTVYLCEHTLMKRRVAVKVLPAKNSADSSSLDRFYREARAVAALDHPNIVRAYDIDKDDNLHFLVMEHVDGASLQEIVKRSPNGISALRACHYIRQSALGLQHAHEKAGLVHRDIKPGNILVDRNGIVKVLDMGLARFFHDEEDQLTKKFDENVLGTADYLAPEQALDSHTADIRADIYSLGGTFYWCLTGKTPFSEGSVAQKLIWHQTRAPKPVRSIRPDVPEAVVAVLDRMMAKNPDHRYQSPQQVADALAPLTQTPIPPPPENEMPQLSLAATRSLFVMGEVSMAGTRTNDGATKKSWTLSGPASPSPSSTAAIPTPKPTPVHRPAVVPSAPAPAPVPAVSAAPAPAPAPAVPVALAPAMAPATPAAPAAPAPAPIQAAPPVVTKAPPVPAAVAVAPVVSQEEAGFVPPPAEPRLPRPRRNEANPPSRNGLWIGVGIGGFLVVAAVAISLFLAFSGPGPKKDPPPRPPLHVTGQTAGGLAQVLRAARDGDRIIIEVDLVEADVFIRQKNNLTIEGAPGKTITWRAPPTLDPVAKLVTVEAVSGLTLKNLTFDGQDRPMALIQVYGQCDGLHIEDVKLKGGRQFGLFFVSAAGSAARPMIVDKTTITTTTPGQTAVRFRTVDSHKTIHANNHLALRGLDITGPGRKLTKQKATDLGASVEIDGKYTVETVK